MKRLKTIRINKSQAEVLKAVMGISPLPKRPYKQQRYKRHDTAIQQLKDWGMLMLPEGTQILQLKTSEDYASKVLIENGF